MFQLDDEKRIFLRDGKEIEVSSEERARLKKLRWWYGLPLEDEPFAPLRLDPRAVMRNFLFDKVEFPDKRVLNIGCRDGLFSLVAESLGGTVSEIDDLPREHSVRPAHDAAKQLLQGSAELLPVSVHEISPETVGVYDIVLLFDVASYQPDALGTIARACSASKRDILIMSHFVVSPDAFPWCALYRNYEPKSTLRHLHGPNILWLIHALGINGFDVTTGQVWNDTLHVTLHAKRNQIRMAARCLPHEDLKSDEGMEDETAILVMSCKKFEQLWDPFFTLFRKYWPDCPYKVYFCSDQGTYPGVENLEVGEDKGWASNCRFALEKIEAKRIILFQEDFFVNGRVNTADVRKYSRHARDYAVGCLRLMPCPGPSGAWYAAESIGTIGPTDDYRLSLQLAIWRRDVLFELLQESQTPWQVELDGTRNARLRPEPFLSIREETTIPIPYYITAVEKGQWKDGAIELLEREGIPTEHIQRKIY